MTDVSINRQEIERLTREIQQEFDKHPIRVPVRADSPALPRFARSTTTIFNGPVIHGNADGAQLAWGNDTVHQAQTRKSHRDSRLSTQRSRRHWNGCPMRALLRMICKMPRVPPVMS